jgi:hypothetical protein
MTRWPVDFWVVCAFRSIVGLFALRVNMAKTCVFQVLIGNGFWINGLDCLDWR